MGLSRDQEKAMFAGTGKTGKGIRKKQITNPKTPIVKGVRFKKGMGIGARVKVIKKFGIDDVPVGTEGTVIDQHFGRERPTVLFHGGARKIMDPEYIEILKGSSKNQPIKYHEIKVYGSQQELKKKLLEDTHRFADGGGEWVKGFEYIDNGMGDYFDFYYRVKIKDNGAEIYVNKSDLPKRWQDSYDQIKEDIIDQVEHDLGIDR